MFDKINSGEKENSYLIDKHHPKQRKIGRISLMLN
jgi:hypothetical protein